MIKVSVLTILVLQLLHMLVKISGQPDCSQYFTRMTEPSKNETWGQVLIPSPPRNVGLHLRVNLSIAVRLPTNYTGQIGLAQSEEDSVLAVEQGRPLLYNIRFPLQQPIPIVTGIWLNNELYCTGSHALESNVSSYVLEYSLNSHTQIPLSPERDQNNDECGRSFTNITIIQLISSKVTILRGEWPWLVAIFRARETIKPLCVGTLLTNRHVLISATCSKNETGENIPLAEIIASFGRYRLTDWQETGSVNKLIENCIIHPEYRFDHFGTDADLAILVLSSPVAYSSNIKPICLWSGPSDLQRVVDKSGYVVGWGNNNLRNGFYTEKPKMSRAPIVSQEDCFRNIENFSYESIANRTFCAGLKSGNGPCTGDNGSGLMLYNAITGRFELRGIVTATILNGITFTCIVEKYVLYIDVTKHMDWINQQISME